MTKAIYPGTFDPVTNGHIDIIKRASRLFDSLIIAIAVGTHKATYFSLSERKRLLEACIPDLPNVSVITFNGLLADTCKELSIEVVIRGLRAVSDFEYELMLALMNRKLNPRFETVFLMPSEQYIYLHSSLVKEVFSLDGDITHLVPKPVLQAFKKKRPRLKR